MTGIHDIAVIGGGVMGSTAALFLARGGMSTALIDRGPLCREASGVNAGTLTLHMTRAALIPYAIRGWEMWQAAEDWLGRGVAARAVEGLSLAFTEAEEDLLVQRARVRQAEGAPIELVDPVRAREIEPGLNPAVRRAAWCRIDGFASAYLTGRAYRHALVDAGADVREGATVKGIDRTGRGFTVRMEGGETLAARRVVLAGGVWLERMLGWLGVHIPVKCLVNQLVVTERIEPVMRTVLSIANGLLSLKQFDNGTVLIGGGWQGIGDPDMGGREAIPENLVGNIRLACHVIPALRATRMARVWLGLEAETADALPLLGDVPGVPGAYVIGSVHSGYTSGPWMGRLLAQHILGAAPEMGLFDPARLLDQTPAGQETGEAIPL
ncbi:FAD-binding oxidoreductase [Hyphomicrobiales bacterium FT118]|uniref:FAD-binding oxidoreductase n=2 Tax=Futiania mangrovi TaxID=2959716 RepID=A0A9J6PEF9_9PROT|nr:FAD-dependent oxidoreductase [Futiania mangrovii]MCP1337805.1 FAD-binding oxidoreductase [Futiania mangrovii]